MLIANTILGVEIFVHQYSYQKFDGYSSLKFDDGEFLDGRVRSIINYISVVRSFRLGEI